MLLAYTDNFVKFRHAVCEQRGRHTDMLIVVLCTPTSGEEITGF